MRETDSRALPGARGARAIGVALALLLLAAPAPAVRVCTYNILNFPGTTGAARADDFRIVLEEVDPDVLVVQEMLSLTGVNQFLNDVLNYSVPGLYSAGPFVDGPDTDNALFYKSSVVELVSHTEIPTALRNISEYVLRPVGYTSTEAQFRVYSFHLKAGSTSTDQTKRLAEATILRNHLNALSPGTYFIQGADYNIRASTEAAYQKLVGSEADNDGRALDPLSRPGNWHDNASYADVHTQSPRTLSFGGGATGGMDDRFDQLLISYSLNDGEGMDFVPGSQVAFGNDGLHFNMAINAGTNYAVSAEVADAIHEAADHIPVYAEFQLPAKIDAPTLLAFGDWIVGTPAVETLGVENIAPAPADELSYTLAIPGGFSGNGGPFEAAQGTLVEHDITMDASSAGQRSGTLTVDSDDPDDPSWAVDLSGTALDHASPSLAESVVVLLDTLDFGTHAEGEFADATVEIWNVGHDALQALLDVHSAGIAGGDGRFSLAGGFQFQDVGGTPAEYAVAFDDAGAEPDSLYSATLTFETRDDDDVAGWAALDDLTVILTARVESGTGISEDVVSDLDLALGSANPFRDGVTLSLSLPGSARAAVEIYDVRGRHVRTLVSGHLTPGIHPVHWDGSDRAGGRAPSGVYFALATVDDWRAARKLVLLR